jgi:DNA-directed RNA polymerase specialized sigma24 family protein
MDERSDETLLAAASTEPEAFAVLYRRHVTPLLAYFVRRTRDAELAADLTAETFAAALDGAHRFDPAKGPGAGGAAARSARGRAGARARRARVRGHRDHRDVVVRMR